MQNKLSGQVDKRILNFLVPDKKIFRRKLIENMEIDIPSIKWKGCTSDYLHKASLHNVLTIPLTKDTTPENKKGATKNMLYYALKSAGYDDEKLGFSIKNPSPLNWLLKALKHVDKDHEYLKDKEEVVLKRQVPEELFGQIDWKEAVLQNQEVPNPRGFFKSNPGEREKIKLECLKRKIKKVEAQKQAQTDLILESNKIKKDLENSLKKYAEKDKKQQLMDQVLEKINDKMDIDKSAEELVDNFFKELQKKQ